MREFHLISPAEYKEIRRFLQHTHDGVEDSDLTITNEFRKVLRAT